MNHDGVAVRVYGVATRLYPRRFRDDYGDDMVSLFRDQCEDEATWRVLSRAAVDLAITIPTQHLEATMHRNPNPLVPLIYLTVAIAGLILAIVGGTNATIAIIGLVIALGAGTVGVIAWRRATPVREATVTGHWWKFLLVGPGLIGLVIVAAGQGVDAWELGVATVIAGFVSAAIGVVLGLSHFFGPRVRRLPT
ncbi:MAG: hypothetical protein JJE46_08135 [Acidimicrobiia bacterium]|nr:hypothetical protein [Acidimicrobiia bacterium]